MILKWVIVIALVYYIHNRFIALPKGEQDLKNLDNENGSNNKKDNGNDDYIDYEEV